MTITKTIETNRDWRNHYATAVQRTSADNLFAQVERTAGGKAVGADQLQLVAKAVEQGLFIKDTDVLLDLCCGNGLITVQIAAVCGVVIGVDYSAALIEVARMRHAAPNIVYMCRDVEHLAPEDFSDPSPTKVCMNAGLQYFTGPMLDRLLRVLRMSNPLGPQLYFSDVPDVAKLYSFYDTPERRLDFQRRLAAHNEAIGTWWCKEDLKGILEKHGYEIEFVEQDPSRSTSRYRFDFRATPV